MMMKVAACDYIPYLIFVTNATDGVRVNFFLAGVNFTDLTRKIGNLLCKLAFYCVNFGVNFIFQKFCPCKKNDKYQVCCIQVYM